MSTRKLEQTNVAAATIAGFTLAQFAFGELSKNGILPWARERDELAPSKAMRERAVRSVQNVATMRRGCLRPQNGSCVSHHVAALV
jgi:hypothetical protein